MGKRGRERGGRGERRKERRGEERRWEREREGPDQVSTEIDVLGSGPVIGSLFTNKLITGLHLTLSGAVAYM